MRLQREIAAVAQAHAKCLAAPVAGFGDGPAWRRPLLRLLRGLALESTEQKIEQVLRARLDPQHRDQRGGRDRRP